MQLIDEKFKAVPPKQTVARIREILEGIGIRLQEQHVDSGISDCFSFSVSDGGCATANGKGVTEDLARASAYAEFIERLQIGLLFYKFQSLHLLEGLNQPAYAPDVRYLTAEELAAEGDWMDDIIRSYPDFQLTRKSLADLCRTLDLSEDGKILTLPYHELLSGTTAYLPISFLTQVYISNGCCAGNTRNEAWVHALSEILERHANVEVLLKGLSMPVIPEETLRRFPIVSRILDEIRANGDYVIDVLDYSMGLGIPVVCTRVIDRRNHSYCVNVAADPVLEIAVQRTLTELFQGKNVRNFAAFQKTVVDSPSDGLPLYNAVNQVEWGKGVYTLDYFANELTCDRTAAVFPDHSEKTNDELLPLLLDLYRGLGKRVYVRNYSFLGFPTYHFIVPGFSEAVPHRMAEPVPEYYVGDLACRAMRDPAEATDEELNLVLAHCRMVRGIYSRNNSFERLSGIPLQGDDTYLLAVVTRAYASWRLGQWSDTVKFLTPYLQAGRNEEAVQYLSLAVRYLSLRIKHKDEALIRCFLEKFYGETQTERLYRNLAVGSPFEEWLLRCNQQDCDRCRYRPSCCLEQSAALIRKVGRLYSQFENGQAQEAFAL